MSKPALAGPCQQPAELLLHSLSHCELTTSDLYRVGRSPWPSLDRFIILQAAQREKLPKDFCRTLICRSLTLPNSRSTVHEECCILSSASAATANYQYRRITRLQRHLNLVQVSPFRRTRTRNHREPLPGHCRQRFNIGTLPKLKLNCPVCWSAWARECSGASMRCARGCQRGGLLVENNEEAFCLPWI